jgi:hypothetical protein
LLAGTASRPWWIGVACAFASHVLLHALTYAADGPDPPRPIRMVSHVALIAQFLVPVMLLITGAIISALTRRSLRRLQVRDAPACPVCLARMIQRKDAGTVFWFCANQPVCKGRRSLKLES